MSMWESGSITCLLHFPSWGAACPLTRNPTCNLLTHWATLARADPCFQTKAESAHKEPCIRETAALCFHQHPSWLSSHMFNSAGLASDMLPEAPALTARNSAGSELSTSRSKVHGGREWSFQLHCMVRLPQTLYWINLRQASIDNYDFVFSPRTTAKTIQSKFKLQ